MKRKMTNHEHSTDPIVSQSDRIETLTNRIKSWNSNAVPEDVDAGSRVEAAPDFKPSESSLYRFQGYLTHKDQRGNGRLIVELVNIDTGAIIPSYFNVNITYQRGPNKGQYFKTGRNGRFWVYPGSKFARFWISTFGQPDKLSTLYRQMKYLKQFNYSGQLKLSATYQQLIDIKKVSRCP